jgi:hypothetical protein
LTVTLGLLPVGAGTGAVLHLYAGMSPAVVIAVVLIITLVPSVAAIICARAPHRPAMCKERSDAEVRKAVARTLDGKITSAEDAAAVLRALRSEAPPAPESADAGTLVSLTPPAADGTAAPADLFPRAADSP